MQDILIVYWDKINSTVKREEVQDCGLMQAIRTFRHTHDYKVHVLSCEYASIEDVIKSFEKAPK